MANTSDSTVVAVFETADSAQAAASELEAAGFNSDQVFVSSESKGYTGAASTGEPRDATHSREGGITGWFKSLFDDHGNDEDYRRYETAHRSGRTIVGVDTSDSNVERVTEILNRYSPVDVHEEGTGANLESRRGATLADRTPASSGTYGSSSADVRTNRLGQTAGAVNAAGVGENIPVVEEELQVGKRTVQRGGVRVHSRVTERPVEETIRLREEHVRVDRQPVDRAASEADFRAAGERVIEVDEFAEEPVIAKQARVIEEVRVGKEATERTETVRDSIRQSELDVENVGAGAAVNRGASALGTASRSNLRTTAGNLDDLDENDADYRQNFAATYPGAASNFNDYAPAYRFGSTLAADPRYSGRNYSEIEPELRAEYGRKYPESAWDRVKDAVRYGWDRATGKTRPATSAR